MPSPTHPNISEYRIVLPMTVEEYQVAQLWSVAEASKNETGGGEGIEVKVNEAFNFEDEESRDHAEKEGYYKNLKDGKYTKGQYTHKIYHLQSRVPSFLRLIAPKGSLDIHEKAWNAYPYCVTIISNPGYMKEGFYIIIETLHCPDRGNQLNAHGLKTDDEKIRKVVHIDIANDPVQDSDYKEEWDPRKVMAVKSENTGEEIGRGPLGGTWTKSVEPVMCAYKLVSCKFKWMGFQNKVEKFIQTQEKRIFTNFHRQVYCWMEKWFGLTMDDIREIERKTKEELDQQRMKGTIRGTTSDDKDAK
ncbi:phosphatidylinositol transfer protein alpha isoform-like [Mizuhopecten yessoensis]|uniref:phosphatidylinositol transfer protein alpha isoform-like n=1 Tax=Mizuhopecten yessoensis TaxID=6573 RepID=UPI000B45DBDB|nr:phosphatidylinositol transfer protein alpha isoform-like [Mizuhopecten yessoensis]